MRNLTVAYLSNNEVYYTWQQPTGSYDYVIEECFTNSTKVKQAQLNLNQTMSHCSIGNFTSLAIRLTTYRAVYNVTYNSSAQVVFDKSTQQFCLYQKI